MRKNLYLMRRQHNEEYRQNEQAAAQAARSRGNLQADLRILGDSVSAMRAPLGVPDLSACAGRAGYGFYAARHGEMTADSAGRRGAFKIVQRGTSKNFSF